MTAGDTEAAQAGGGHTCRQLPRQVVSILDACVHAKAACRGKGMSCVSGQQHAPCLHHSDVQAAVLDSSGVWTDSAAEILFQLKTLPAGA